MLHSMEWVQKPRKEIECCVNDLRCLGWNRIEQFFIIPNGESNCE